jgi:hypothetical protein
MVAMMTTTAVSAPWPAYDSEETAEQRPDYPPRFAEVLAKSNWRRPICGTDHKAGEL